MSSCKVPVFCSLFLLPVLYPRLWSVILLLWIYCWMFVLFKFRIPFLFYPLFYRFTAFRLMPERAWIVTRLFLGAGSTVLIILHVSVVPEKEIVSSLSYNRLPPWRRSFSSSISFFFSLELSLMSGSSCIELVGV